MQPDEPTRVCALHDRLAHLSDLRRENLRRFHLCGSWDARLRQLISELSEQLGRSEAALHEVSQIQAKAEAIVAAPSDAPALARLRSDARSSMSCHEDAVAKLEGVLSDARGRLGPWQSLRDEVLTTLGNIDREIRECTDELAVLLGENV